MNKLFFIVCILLSLSAMFIVASNVPYKSEIRSPDRTATPTPNFLITRWECGVQEYIYIGGPDTITDPEAWIYFYNGYFFYTEQLTYVGPEVSPDYGYIHKWTSNMSRKYSDQFSIRVLTLAGLRKPYSPPLVKSYVCLYPEDKLYFPMLVKE